MAVCEICDQEMLIGVGCTQAVFDDFPDSVPRERIRFGDETHLGSGRVVDSCQDCDCPRGTFHHPGCDMEECPMCRQQALGCGCTDIEAEEDGVSAFDDLPEMPVWGPIEQFFGSSDAPELQAFIYVQVNLNKEAEPVYHYEHLDTGWRLRLDNDATPYRYDKCRVCLVPTSRETALAMLYDFTDRSPQRIDRL